MQIPIVDLSREFKKYQNELVDIFIRVGSSGQYVFGEDVCLFEQDFAKFCGTEYAISCANASDGLEIGLRALGVGPGDEVITAANSFISSGGSIAACGAMPVFADVTDDLLIDPASVESLISEKTKAIMPVHLTGRPAPMNEITAIAKAYGLSVIEDAAQAIGAEYYGQKVGALGDIAVFSLHPLKNLHVYGDGGIITTKSDTLNSYMIKFRNHGLIDRDRTEFWGRNSRLDTLQAAIARFKLTKMDEINKRFISIATKYNHSLSNLVTTPYDKPHEVSVYHNYVILTERRDDLMTYLKSAGIDVKIRYPLPLTKQNVRPQKGIAPNAEILAKRMLSLPIFPTITEAETSYVVSKVEEFFKDAT